jgi:hypothetical protein
VTTMQVFWRMCAVAFLLGACQLAALPDDTFSDRPELAIHVSLELRHGDQWQPVNAQTVFHNNDEIRFRFRTSLGGYLYVAKAPGSSHGLTKERGAG